MENRIEHIIVRYLAGEATREELEKLEAWVDASEENRRQLDEMSDLYHAARLASGRGEQHRPPFGEKVPAGRNRRHSLVAGLWRYAAVAVIAAALGGYLSYVFPGGVASEEVLHVPAGSVVSLTLPDSTRVWVNAESSLRWDARRFGRGGRKVFLTGEAYFDVTHKRGARFEVVTPDVTVRVYGTRFNVKAYPEDATVETTLEEGKIELLRNTHGRESAGKPIVLKPAQRAVLVKKEGRLLLSDVVTVTSPQKGMPEEITVRSGNILVADSVDTEVYTSWKEGRLIIRSEPLEHLAKKLERRYDVRIIFRDEEARDIRFTGVLENETLEQVLLAIQLTSPIRYTIDHKTVYLEKIR